MIRAAADFDALARRLTARAKRLATARLAARLLAARRDERRWRRAALVWPLFGQG